jgi:hypothetical protein
MTHNGNNIESRLWEAADQLRANSKLKSSEYSVPVLGLVFLRYADYKFQIAAKRVTPAVARQIVESVDLLKPATPEQVRGTVLPENKPTNNQITEAGNMPTAKAVSIQETKTEKLEAGKKRGRPKSAVEGLVHFSTWLPEGLAWAIRAKAVELHKKDYEVVTEAIKTYLESSS